MFRITLVSILILTLSPVSALTLRGHVQMLHSVDVFLGYESGFMTVHLSNENYTIYVSDGKIYEIKPDPTGNFSIDLPPGTYRIWVNVTVLGKNRILTSGNVIYTYPSKRKPLIVDLTNDTFVNIEPAKGRYFPPEPIMPHVRLRIIGRVFNPEHRNLTIILYMTEKPIYRLKTITNNDSFEFDDVLPAKNYTIEVSPKDVIVDGCVVRYGKAYVNFNPRPNSSHRTVEVTVSVPFKMECLKYKATSKKTPGFELITALLSLPVARRLK